MKYSNLLGTIGNTPLLKLKNHNVFVKLEGWNPGGSIKDRAALYMLEKAEQSGQLHHGKTILEATSGNMGIALAMIGAYKGYKVKIVMSDKVSKERRMILSAFSAEVVLTDGRFGTDGAKKKALEIFNSDPDAYWFADQFNNVDNLAAHYFGIADEIIKEVPDVKFIVAGVGTGGTLMGIAKRFRRSAPDVKIVQVLPPPGYMIQGIQNPELDFSGCVYDPKLVDFVFNVSFDSAVSTVRDVARNEGLFVGLSSGANLFAAFQIAGSSSGSVVTILPDRGEKYLSTGLFA